MKETKLVEIWKYDVFQEVNEKTEEKWDMSLLYGEITRKSTEKLFNYLRTNKLVPRKWSFIDIGSGFGKMVFHAALEEDIIKSTGVEILKSKHEVAQKNLENLINKFPDFPEHKINLINENFNKLEKLDYSVVYHNSISWPKKTIIDLNTISPNSIHITTKSISGIHDSRIEKLGNLKIKFSWNKDDKLTPVYFYKLKNK